MKTVQKPIALNERSYNVTLLHKALEALGLPVSKNEVAQSKAGQDTLKQVRALQTRLNVPVDDSVLCERGGKWGQVVNLELVKSIERILARFIPCTTNDIGCDNDVEMVGYGKTLLVRKTHPTILNHVGLSAGECWWDVFLHRGDIVRKQKVICKEPLKDNSQDNANDALINHSKRQLN